jgi:hypothetical protein
MLAVSQCGMASKRLLTCCFILGWPSWLLVVPLQNNTHCFCRVFGLVSLINGANSILLKILQEPLHLDKACKRKRVHEKKNVMRDWSS